MAKQSKTKVTKAQMVLAIVSRTPECVLQDVCDALDLQASTAGNLLRQLHAAGKLHRTHNGYTFLDSLLKLDLINLASTIYF